ncbi:helix-turn-helix domain-containing protein [Flavobacterium suncheonense]|uniref:HTH cro/C1-type domain-containing protein n=1 Tax=Flavobacterium suncheonense GH29-5 = DSM 17707 TaxID=1121899 RepID=A0A0A2MD85_9FLAO|nr:helix-turn-helix transcriptional regulator [Flavobacterium suncheonense]KGO89576.1 hypothetical protein Q764_07340 [Flavobacterium suncheonense GH29-5 = DSM 17707]
MKNYISLNIKHLCEKNFLSQDEFGLLFNLKKGVVGTYVREIAVPKLETLQKISIHFGLTIDDFVNRPLSDVSNIANEPKPSYGYENEMLKLKDEVINLQKNEIERLKEKIEMLSKSNDSKTA